jgi:hypothetical protein
MKLLKILDRKIWIDVILEKNICLKYFINMISMNMLKCFINMIENDNN